MGLSALAIIPLSISTRVPLWIWLMRIRIYLAVKVSYLLSLMYIESMTVENLRCFREVKEMAFQYPGHTVRKGGPQLRNVNLLLGNINVFAAYSRMISHSCLFLIGCPHIIMPEDASRSYSCWISY